MPITAGTILRDHIRLERELGRGAMGVVWEATNLTLGNRVAVKILHTRAGLDQQARTRFEHEARTVAQLDSPHIVRIFDFGLTDEGDPFIVMELLRGRDLKQLIEEQGALPLDQATSIIGQLCRGLGRAHEFGLIHRDIKPANVFLLESDGEAFVKILDFGIAKAAGSDMGLTETGAVMGTPYYMSPEQFVNPRGVDLRSDLWSVAVVGFACVTGSLPFHGQTIGALSLAVHNGTFSTASTIRSGIPAALDAFFARALQVDANARHASARELADAFATAVGGAQPAARAVAVAVPTAHGQPAAMAASHAAPMAASHAAPMAASHAAPMAASHAAPMAASHAAPMAASHAAPMAASHAAPMVASHAAPMAASHAAPLQHGYAAPLAGNQAPMAHGAPIAGSQPYPMMMPGATAPTAHSHAAPDARGSRMLWLGIVLSVFALGAVAAIFLLPLRDDTGTDKSARGEPADASATPSDTPASASASSDTDQPTTSTAIGSKPVAPKPVAAKPVAPKPAAPRYGYTGTSCVAMSNKTCPATCCRPSVGGGPRDIAQYTPAAAGKKASCRCMRPLCGPGENWTTHQCKH